MFHATGRKSSLLLPISRTLTVSFAGLTLEMGIISMFKKLNWKIAVPAAIVILIVLIVLKVFVLDNLDSGTRIGFVGNSTSHVYEGSYSKITGTFSHRMSPSGGSSSVHCEVTTTSGSLQVDVLDADINEVIYSMICNGNEVFDVPVIGKIKIRLLTDGHSGSYRFTY